SDLGTVLATGCEPSGARQTKHVPPETPDADDDHWPERRDRQTDDEDPGLRLRQIEEGEQCRARPEGGHQTWSHALNRATYSRRGARHQPTLPLTGPMEFCNSQN